MRKIERLKREAREGATFRGHDLSQFRRISNDCARAVCKRCNMGVRVSQRPAPNEIDIGGEAVGLNCNV